MHEEVLKVIEIHLVQLNHWNFDRIKDQMLNEEHIH